MSKKQTDRNTGQLCRTLVLTHSSNLRTCERYLKINQMSRKETDGGTSRLLVIAAELSKKQTDGDKS